MTSKMSALQEINANRAPRRTRTRTHKSPEPTFQQGTAKLQKCKRTLEDMLHNENDVDSSDEEDKLIIYTREPNSGRVVQLKGPYSGCDDVTYRATQKYFEDLEKKGIKVPAAKKAKTTKTPTEPAKLNVDGITLPGEEDDDVPVFDTCDDLRPKIQAHLRRPGITQASFLREIVKTYNDPKKKLQSKQLQDFLQKTGATSGNTSSVYYAASVFFEKLRIKQGKEKSEKRLELQDLYINGLDRTTLFANVHYIYCTDGGMVPCEDAYGVVGMA